MRIWQLLTGRGVSREGGWLFAVPCQCYLTFLHHDPFGRFGLRREMA